MTEEGALRAEEVPYCCCHQDCLEGAALSPHQDLLRGPAEKTPSSAGFSVVGWRILNAE